MPDVPPVPRAAGQPIRRQSSTTRPATASRDGSCPALARSEPVLSLLVRWLLVRSGVRLLPDGPAGAPGVAGITADRLRVGIEAARGRMSDAFPRFDGN